MKINLAPLQPRRGKIMNELKKYKYPLMLIAILCLFKFIIVPVFTWQDALIAENKLLERKVSKVESLIDDENALNSKLETTKNSLNELLTYFYPAKDAQAFRLAKQKEIEQQLAKYELKSSTVGWQNTVAIPDTPLTRFQLQYSFSGQSDQAIAYLLAQQSMGYWHELETLNINVRRQKAGRLGQMSITLRVSFYMLNEELSNG